MDDYLPSALPDISAVKVVDLRGINPPRVSLYMSAVEAPSVLVEGEAAQRIADLWRRLPASEVARCHTPPFGLRFLVGNEVICQASICWRCDNIYGDVGGKTMSCAFDGEAEVSRSLLAELRRVIGVFTESDGTRGYFTDRV